MRETGPAAALLVALAALLALPLQGHRRPVFPTTVRSETVRPGHQMIKFRLLFASSTKRNANPSAIATYATPSCRHRAAAGHTDIQAVQRGLQGGRLHSGPSTPPTTRWLTTGTGVPIYWLDGDKCRRLDYADFYDGSWDSRSPTTETGASFNNHLH